jgi:hypothetical protein
LLRQEVAARVERESEELKLLEQQARARKRVEELRADADELRLARLEERLKKYPLAAQYEWEDTQLEVARALAGNSRAVLQVGNAGEIARALVLTDLMRLAPENGERDGAGATAEIAATEPAASGMEEGAGEPPGPQATATGRRRRTKSG